MLKNITLSAEEVFIRKAREKAAQEHKSLNGIFREWIAQYVDRGGHSEEYRRLMKRLHHVQAGRAFSRDEMNER